MTSASAFARRPSYRSIDARNSRQSLRLDPTRPYFQSLARTAAEETLECLQGPGSRVDEVEAGGT